MKKYLIFDLDWTLIDSNHWAILNAIRIVHKIDKTLWEKARYIFSTTPWLSIYKQLELIFEWKKIENNLIRSIWDKIYLKLRKKEDKFDFFEGIPEMIKELSKKYDLYLTTWNSTKFAKEMLKKWEIKEHFELILWSNKINKWHLHLEIFKDYSWDKDFYKKALYSWDWDMDRIFATEAAIDFVHIWKGWKDKYEIDYTIKLPKILKLFKKK